MTTYSTTRGGSDVGLADAVFGGLAPDGGLYVPSSLPRIEGPWGGGTESFVEVARSLAPIFFPDVAPDRLHDTVNAALSFPVPIAEPEPGRFVLELYHGPTLAFKDVGARFMAGLMPLLDREAEARRGTGLRTVLVATSGDTGGAVASAFHQVRGFRVVVLFPRDGISERQRRQMTTLGGNVRALSVGGTFDDCQRMVKEAFLDRELAEACSLTSANSINVARLIPQAFYYVHAARRLGTVHFVVPSGNLGNLCAGLLAARAGMPAAGFTAAVNANRGFSDFLGGAAFLPRPSVRTASNAMDVGMPSNLERIRWLYGGDDEALRSDVRGVSVSDDEAARCIAGVHARTGYVMDPHTAVAYEAANRHDPRPDAPVVVLATAHPAKFPETVEAAIGCAVPVPAALLERQTEDEYVTPLAPTNAALRHMLLEPPS